ncbi:hypothetical protein [Nocardiopsis chromatogenes]|uniref:hypothetical protein n=1 Tax=Nocardiopsis chromatogenes TaxID=280239 RepID=UPI00034DAA56|nr:hypothetical protein [Nocardiopsis chromatogenes]
MGVPRAAAHFPLVPRPRPAALPLEERVARIQQDAVEAERDKDGGGLEAAARVFNRAALLFSDVGLHDEAARLCWEHADLYVPAYPLDGYTARMSLEPVVNLARLAIRAGDGTSAYRILDTLNNGATEARPVQVEGRTLHLDRITATAPDRRELVKWLWTVRLGDGLRALAAAGRWQQAEREARRHGGVGERLFDGRQIAVVAAIDRGDTDEALALVTRSQTHEPWERAVAACLEVLARNTVGEITEQAGSLLGARIEALGKDTPIVFTTRLAIAAADIAAHGHLPTRVTRTIIRQAAEDGYAAHGVLASWASSVHTADRDALEEAVLSAGIGHRAVPTCLRECLRIALEFSRGRFSGR